MEHFAPFCVVPSTVTHSKSVSLSHGSFHIFMGFLSKIVNFKSFKTPLEGPSEQSLV